MLGDNQQGVLARVHGEMHASFVWLFQDIFASTLALMVSPMLLLANFIVHSMGQCRSSHPSRSAFHRGCRGASSQSPNPPRRHARRPAGGRDPLRCHRSRYTQRLGPAGLHGGLLRLLLSFQARRAPPVRSSHLKEGREASHLAGYCQFAAMPQPKCPTERKKADHLQLIPCGAPAGSCGGVLQDNNVHQD
ncbi:hypothetical protein DAI22_08g138000 [Oryza sativa Japonica Group]|nr:hypothetical protein DAI22_08g138000 [Oryza sativa Japonica Group]